MKSNNGANDSVLVCSVFEDGEAKCLKLKDKISQVDKLHVLDDVYIYEKTASHL